MNATNPQNDHAGSAGSVPAACPLVLVRLRPDRASERERVVHFVPLPTGEAGAVTALCGMLLHRVYCEDVKPGHGAPCDRCMASHLQHTTATPKEQCRLVSGDCEDVEWSVPDFIDTDLGCQIG